MLNSVVQPLGAVCFPQPTGIRVMMLPFLLHDLSSLPDNIRESYGDLLEGLLPKAPAQQGVGYLTIDEAEVEAGEHHRRPGLHIDGAINGGWGGPGPWGGAQGMLVAASHTGCRAWDRQLSGWAPNGSCEHLRSELDGDPGVLLEGGQAYLLGPQTVHESLPQGTPAYRQFLRVSMPSTAPWYHGYTVNPKVAPTGPILPRRPEMDFRT